MKPVILVLDDEADLLQVLKEALCHALPEYDIRATATVEQAESVLEELNRSGGTLALAVVDHMLGGPTGIDFLEQLKGRQPGVPAMLFTGQAPATVEARAAAINVKVLWKPLPLSTWLAEVRQQLS